MLCTGRAGVNEVTPALSVFPPVICQAANGDLMEAVTFLTEEHAEEPAPEAAATEPSAWEGSAVGKQLPQSESLDSARGQVSDRAKRGGIGPLRLCGGALRLRPGTALGLKLHRDQCSALVPSCEASASCRTANSGNGS